ncbi:MAG TPA: MBL fold metallo-hydrolase [Bacillota bacterium]|nr:MBL fold metallo-hydrolase [Bacillota bacterium]
MNLAICSLASGSSGNSYVIYSKRGALLIDAGISARRICQSLERLGIGPDALNAVLLTHEHSDHTRGLAALAKKTGAVLYASAETLKVLGSDFGFDARPIGRTDAIEIADMEVRSFAVSHDAADPVGYSVSSGGRCVSVISDTGIITEEIFEVMKRSNILVLETNHDESILRVGRYPYFLKQRILSDKGHLSNACAARALASALCEEREEREEGGGNGIGRRQVLLAHLSKENNFPEMALTTMENILEAEGFAFGKEVTVEVLPRSEISPVYSV